MITRRNALLQLGSSVGIIWLGSSVLQGCSHVRVIAPTPRTEPGADVVSLFDQLVPQMLDEHPEKANIFHTICRFTLADIDKGTWLLNLRGIPPTCMRDTSTQSADVTITVSVDDFRAIAFNPALEMHLYFQGQLKISGDPLSAFALLPWLSGLLHNRHIPHNSKRPKPAQTPDCTDACATIITDECINCGACIPECPNEAISENQEIYVINPKRCTECVGFHDYEACQAVCPVECCIPNPACLHSEEVLLTRARRLHPKKEFPLLADLPATLSRFRK